jgi:hypothetical protein
MKEKSKGWCCELCGILIKGYCENNKGFVTCLNENCLKYEKVKGGLKE